MSWRHALYPGEPVIALVFPIATGSIGEEVDFGEILDVFVAELDRRVDSQRRAVVGVQIMAVHAIGEQSLRMKRAAEVPRRPVDGVERAKLYVAHAGVDAYRAREIAQAQTVPRRDRRPAFDAVMAHAHGGLRHGLQLIKREHAWARNHPAHLERPSDGRKWHRVGDEITRERKLGSQVFLGRLRGEARRRENETLETLVEAQHPLEKKRNRMGRVASGQQRSRSEPDKELSPRDYFSHARLR